MIYHLTGRTKKGKQRIKQHGTQWLVVEKRKGTFGDVLLRSIKTSDLRWLTEDFFVERIEGNTVAEDEVEEELGYVLPGELKPHERKDTK
jgi:hypothetical protein